MSFLFLKLLGPSSTLPIKTHLKRSPETLKLSIFVDSVILVWPLLILMYSHQLLRALKEFELSFALALVWPQTLAHSHQLLCPLKKFELSSTLSVSFGLKLSCTLINSHALSKSLTDSRPVSLPFGLCYLSCTLINSHLLTKTLNSRQLSSSFDPIPVHPRQLPCMLKNKSGFREL